MHITALRPSVARPAAKAARPPAPPAGSPDQVQLSHAKPGKLRRMATNLVKNTTLAALPALGTCAAMALGGPNAAGLALAGGMVASGLYALATCEGDKFNVFGSGGLYGLISGAAGMVGPEGVAMMAGAGAFRECMKWGLDLAENGSIDASL